MLRVSKVVSTASSPLAHVNIYTAANAGVSTNIY